MSAATRDQVATFIREFPDRVRATFQRCKCEQDCTCWSPVWSEVPRKFRMLVPVPAAGEPAGSDGHDAGGGDDVAPPSPALYLMLPCPVCRARVNASCTTRFGENTGPHKARRLAAAAAAVIRSET